MAKCFIYNSSSLSKGLNIISSLEEPTNPKEADIWIKTDKNSKNCVFSAEEPTDPNEGLIWFKASSASLLIGVIIKIQIYTENAWTLVEGYMYLGGSWIQLAALWNGQLFDQGEQFKDITGGWLCNNSYFGSGSIGNTLYGGSTGNTSDQGSIIYMKNVIEASSFTTFNFSTSGAGSTSYCWLMSGSNSGSSLYSKGFSGTGTFTINLDSTKTKFCPKFRVGSKQSFNITKVWLA